MSRPPLRAAALALALAAVAAALAPAAAAQDATYDYRFAWRETASGLTEFADTTPEGYYTELEVPVDATNLTVVRFLLAWDDQIGAEDTLRLTVFDPEGREHGSVNATAGLGGEIEIIARVAEMPPGTVTVRAAADEEAWDVFLNRYPDSTAGRGMWKAQVAVEHAGDGGDGVLGLGGEPDDEQAWHLEVAIARWHGVLQERTAVVAEEPPQPNPTEMPPTDEPEAPPALAPPPQDEPRAGVLATKGAQSALVVAAAVGGVAAALLIARRRSEAV